MQYSLFSAECGYGFEWYKFKKSTWGKLQETLPLAELSALLPPLSALGNTPYFDNYGMVALLFLKHQLGVSDEKLIEHLNHNVSLQLFCGLRLGKKLIRDTGIVSRIRSYLGKHLKVHQFQDILVKNCQSELSDTHFLKMDATCFESYIRYPTDVQLLWDCCEWVYQKQLFVLRKSIKTPLGKEKERFDVQRRKYLIYRKLRRKSYKKTKKRKKSLLNLLKRGISALQVLLNQHFKSDLSSKFYTYFKTIKTIYRQQKYLYDHPEKKVKGRIVSLHKPYIRPIKRGKMNKPTEFGAKVHMMQVDGINVIEHLSFEAFNECKRLKTSVIKHKHCFGECHQLSADRIYPTNENRRFCTREKIFTNFIPKGRKSAHYKASQTLKNALNKDRATRLEGSFGNVKNHYGLAKVKARTQPTEIIWIYFGVWTANAMQLVKKRQKEKPNNQKNSYQKFLF